MVLQRMSPIKAANKILHLWQNFGPNQNIVDLDHVVTEIINRSSGLDYLSTSIIPLPKIDGAMVRSESDPNSYTAFASKEIRNNGRKRFTLAHEIGHFVLHRKKQHEFKCTRGMMEDFRSGNIETEANLFAAQLLLPPNRVRDFSLRPWNLETLCDIAETFDVSLQAAGLRMVQLSSRPIAFVVSTSDMVEWGISSPSLFKKGCYFKAMDDVPAESTAFGSDFSTERLEISQVFDEGWRIQESYKEISMSGYDGRVYTCIDVS